MFIYETLLKLEHTNIQQLLMHCDDSIKTNYKVLQDAQCDPMQCNAKLVQLSSSKNRLITWKNQTINQNVCWYKQLL